MAVLFLVGVLILLWKGRLFPLASVSMGWAVLLGCFLMYPFFQAVPLPLSWVEALSPERFNWLKTAAEMTGLKINWSSLSYTPLDTLFSGAWWIFLLLFALILYKALKKEKRTLGWFFSLLFAIATLEAFYGLFQALIPSLGVLWTQIEVGKGCARGTFINRNHYAAFLGMLWPLLLARLLAMGPESEANPSGHVTHDKEQLGLIRQRQMFMGFMIGLIVLALFFSRSRGGIVSSLIALTVFVILGKKRRAELLVFIAGCWFVMFVYGGMIGFDAILERFNQLGEEKIARFLTWRETWALSQDHLTTGSGLGSYSTVFRLYQTHLPDFKWVGHAHNDYLQLMAELGLPVATGMCLFGWGYWWRMALRLWRRSNQTSRGDHYLAAGALAGASSFLVHCLAEFNWQIPANQLLFVSLLVLIKVYCPKRQER